MTAQMESMRGSDFGISVRTVEDGGRRGEMVEELERLAHVDAGDGGQVGGSRSWSRRSVDGRDEVRRGDLEEDAAAVGIRDLEGLLPEVPLQAFDDLDVGHGVFLEPRVFRAA